MSHADWSVPARRRPGPTQPPLNLELLFGPPALLEGEDEDTYKRLYDRVRTDVGPNDIIEEFWARDIIDLVWEALRLRRLKALLVRSAAPQALTRVLHDLVPTEEKVPLSNAWAKHDDEARDRVERVLGEAGQDEEMINAQALAIRLDEVGRIDNMIMRAEARRNVVLREIARHREALAERLRDAAATIEDAEFRDITTERGA